MITSGLKPANGKNENGETEMSAEGLGTASAYMSLSDSPRFRANPFLFT